MATATIIRVWCLNPSTSIDVPVFQAFADLLNTILPSDLGGLPLEDFVNGIPGIAAAIDNATADPDNVYLTIKNSDDINDALWPPEKGKTVDMSAGQSVWPGTTIATPATLSIYDNDAVLGSDDDLMGSVDIFTEEAGTGEITKLASSETEQSVYYVTYRVD